MERPCLIICVCMCVCMCCVCGVSLCVHIVCVVMPCVCVVCVCCGMFCIFMLCCVCCVCGVFFVYIVCVVMPYVYMYVLCVVVYTVSVYCVCGVCMCGGMGGVGACIHKKYRWRAHLLYRKGSSPESDIFLFCLFLLFRQIFILHPALAYLLCFYLGDILFLPQNIYFYINLSYLLKNIYIVGFPQTVASIFFDD